MKMDGVPSVFQKKKMASFFLVLDQTKPPQSEDAPAQHMQPDGQAGESETARPH